MVDTSPLSPHLSDQYSPLSALIASALRRFGAFPSAKVDGNTTLMFVELANEVIDDIRSHPYWDKTSIKYYTSQEEVRSIPDPIMRAGLIAKYAIQQQSDKASTLVPIYYRTLNQELWRIKTDAATQIQMTVMDDGSNPTAAGERNIDLNTGFEVDE